MNLAERKKKLRQGRLWCSLEISEIGFAGLFFVLLVTVMVDVLAPKCDLGCGPSVDLARVARPIYMPGADGENAIVIAVLRDGTTFFGRDKITADQIAYQIRKKVRTGSERKVYIKVDKRVKYGHVINVINAVSDSGISDVGLVVDQEKRMP